MSEPSDLGESGRRAPPATAGPAESVTGGEVARGLHARRRVQRLVPRRLVAWQHRAKYELLGVPEGDPVVTADAARAMAAGAAKLLDATVTVATTGAAGPSGQDGAPPGRAYVATWVDGRTAVRELQVPGPPPTVCAATVVAALELLLDELG